LYLKRDDMRILYVIALTPSVLFWSSILGKDPVAMLGISSYILGVARCHARRNTSGIPMALFGVIVASFIRPWLAGILVIPLGVFALFGLRSMWARALVVAAGMGAMVAAAQGSATRLGVKNDDPVAAATTLNQRSMLGGSVMHETELKDTSAQS